MKPLGFDRVMDGRPLAAQDSWLFRFPLEILTGIISYLGDDVKDLESLALVNSDCRQLARSWQFVKLELTSKCELKCELTGKDLKKKCEPIIASLLSEILRRRQIQVNCLPSPSLGVCIRHLDVQLRADLPEHLQTKTDICSIMAGLPNLKSLTMGVYLGATSPQVGAGVQWPVEVLDLWMFWYLGLEFGDHPEWNASEAWNNMLRPCAPTLQTLKLRHECLYPDERDGSSEMPVAFNLEFPKLRILDIPACSASGSFDQTALQSLIFTSTCLSTLHVSFDAPGVEEFFESAGTIASLKNFVVNDVAYYRRYRGGGHLPLRFLERNPQLHALGMRGCITLENFREALQILQSSRVSKLALTWEESEISAHCLHALGNLSLLEDVAIGCSLFDMEDHNTHHSKWFVSHTTIREALGPRLYKLKRLAFSYDMYEYPDDPDEPEGAGNIVQSEDSDGDVPSIKEFYSTTRYFDYDIMRFYCWKQHVQNMQKQAVEYAKTFVRLEELFIGDLLFHISRDGSKIVLDMQDSDGYPYDWEGKFFGLFEAAQFKQVIV